MDVKKLEISDEKLENSGKENNMIEYEVVKHTEDKDGMFDPKQLILENYESEVAEKNRSDKRKNFYVTLFGLYSAFVFLTVVPFVVDNVKSDMIKFAVIALSAVLAIVMLVVAFYGDFKQTPRYMNDKDLYIYDKKYVVTRYWWIQDVKATDAKYCSIERESEIDKDLVYHYLHIGKLILAVNREESEHIRKYASDPTQKGLKTAPIILTTDEIEKCLI